MANRIDNDRKNNNNNIIGLKFDKESKKAIQDIKRRKKLFKALKPIIAGGTIINIFVGNKSYEVVVNIYLTDFKTMGEAIRSIGELQRKTISNIAADQALFHTGKQHLFWSGVHDELER